MKNDDSCSISSQSAAETNESMISFIMPAKNASLYVGQAIDSLRQASYEDWELVVLNDHSTDDTLALLREAEKEDSRIRVYENDGYGKVLALNNGYRLANGDLIKCIDADDVLAPAFFDFLPDMTGYDASCHDYYIVDRNLRVLGEYSMNRAFFSRTFDYCLKNLISLPRCVWLFNRSVGNMIFPMPDNLPFEDVWFSLIIKKYAGANIRHISKPLYYYRQHNDQAFGGVLNFESDTVSFRARRMLQLMDVIRHEQTKRLVSEIDGQNTFGHAKRFYELLAQETLNLGEIITSRVPLGCKAKLLIYRKLRFLAPLIVRLKWSFDKR